MKKNLLFATIMVTAIYLFAFGIMSASADSVSSGICGENLTWTLDDTGTLTISGSGPMSDWDFGNAPWYSERKNIIVVNVGENVTYIGESAFYNCPNITDITVGNNVKSIGMGAFCHCESIENIFLGESVETIALDVFYNCDSLINISVPDSNNYFSSSEGNLYNKAKTTLIQYAIGKADAEYEIPDGILIIGNGAFAEGRYLEKITIPESVETIELGAFWFCTGLTSVDIPDSVTEVGGRAFYYCSGLTDVAIGNGVTSIGAEAFNGCENIEKLTIGSSVEIIADDAFYGCKKISDIVLPESLVSIGDSAFQYCPIKSLNIPKTVISIGRAAFLYCDNLTDVYYNGTEEEWGEILVGDFNEALLNATLHFYKATPAEKLFNLINEQVPNSCVVDVDIQTVTLTSNLQLSSMIEIPVGGEIILDVKTFNILGANESDALYIPAEASLKIIGTGTIRGGNTIDEQYNYVGSAVSNDGILRIWGPTLVGGNEREMYCYAAPGIRGWGTTYFIEGNICAGEGNYSDYVNYTKGDYAIVLESDDGINYTVAKQEWGSNKRFIKAVIIPQGLSATEEFSTVLNIIQPGTCSVEGNKVTLNKDFSCPYTIEIPKGNIIVLDFNGHTVTTDDFFMPFIIPEQAEIVFKGGGVLTNKEKASGTSSGGMGGSAALISNEGSLVINGVTVVGVGLNGIYNDGTLTVQSGKITVSDYSSGKDAITNSGTIEVFGGEIIGGNATRDGRDGGDGISAMSGAVSIDGTYPIKLYGGILCGGKGLGDGENGRAISTRFNIGEVCIAYESDNGENYSEVDDTRSYARYLKIVNKNDNPEIEDGNFGDLGNPSAQNVINTNNVTFDGEKVTFDIVLTSNETITGNVYVAVYEGKILSLIKHYTAETEIPVSVECTNGQNIKVFWWNTFLAPISHSKNVEF